VYIFKSKIGTYVTIRKATWHHEHMESLFQFSLLSTY